MTVKSQRKTHQLKSAFWQQHIDNQRHSSLSQLQYCREYSLALSTFQYWKKKLNDNPLPFKSNFYPLTVQPVPPREIKSRPSGLSVRISPGEMRIEIAEEFSGPTLTKLLTVLRQP